MEGRRKGVEKFQYQSTAGSYLHLSIKVFNFSVTQFTYQPSEDNGTYFIVSLGLNERILQRLWPVAWHLGRSPLLLLLLVVVWGRVPASGLPRSFLWS